jgi:hypothetical protein
MKNRRFVFTSLGAAMNDVGSYVLVGFQVRHAAAMQPPMRPPCNRHATAMRPPRNRHATAMRACALMICRVGDAPPNRQR